MGLLKILNHGNSLVVKTLHFHSCGPRLDPWSGNEDAASRVAQQKQKTNQKNPSTRSICIQHSSFYFLFLNKFIHFIYLFLAALGLHCCTRAFSSCSEWGLVFVVVCRLVIAVASLVAEHGL